MSETIKNVVVLGASGTVGTALIHELQLASFNITALTRDSSAAVFPAGVRSVRVDYKDLAALTEIFAKQDAIVSTVAPFGVPDQSVAVDAAVKAGVKRFIPSEFGLDTSLPHAAEVAPFVVGKQGIVRHLKEKEAEGLSWTAICSSAFFPWQLELGSGKMGWDVANHSAVLFDGGTQPYDASTVTQLARAIVSTLQHPAETANSFVYVKSFTLTQQRVLDTLERLSGQKYDLSHASAVEVQKQGLELLKQGDRASAYPKITTGATFGPWKVAEFGDKTDKWMKILGLKLEEGRFDDVVKESLERIEKTR